MLKEARAMETAAEVSEEEDVEEDLANSYLSVPFAIPHLMMESLSHNYSRRIRTNLSFCHLSSGYCFNQSISSSSL
uniref:Uncharacterized protein n=1 Tax=Ditylenchus dipsaci TaxID=166011 RepID=A0A915EQD5_9BILA